MSVYDLISEQDQAKIHKVCFSLWPQKWEAYSLCDPFNWQIHPFEPDQTDEIPRQPGIYSFLIRPGIASFPYSSYLMYIGKTQHTLRRRFTQYLYEQNSPSGRSNIVRLLIKYQGYVHFCFSVVNNTERIASIEDALIAAFLPPCNTQLPTEVRNVIGAF